MRAPVPIPVQATFVRPRLDVTFDAPDDDIIDDDEDFAGVEDDDEDEEDEVETEGKRSRETVSDGAPWSPVPLRPARDLVKRHPESAIDVVFPTVYEEDRTAKLKDL